jgi:hypothetical protein
MRTDNQNRTVDLRDLGLAAFVLLGVFWQIVLWTEAATSADPLWTYYHNPAIRLICLAALLTDFAILGSAIGRFSAIRYHHKRLDNGLFFLLSLLALVGAGLTWLELWYGSTFYYGEVRDKQGLPFNVNHGGPVGSSVFLAYVLWGLPLGHLRRIPAFLLKAMCTLILLLGHWVILRLVERPWELWHS